MLHVGEFTLSWTAAGSFRLDGGAMFGVVPKLLWHRQYPCNDDNLIPMRANCPVVDTGRHRLLIDTGLGAKLSPKQRRIYRIAQQESIRDRLASSGIAPASIDYVILTHLHFDHSGGATIELDGDTVPALPNATYCVHHREWQAAVEPNARTKNTYWTENWQPLKEHDCVELVGDTETVLPGIDLIHTGGHSSGHLAVKIHSGGETALHLGDLLSTHAHVNPGWIPAYDEQPLQSLEQKKHWLSRAAAEGWWLTFCHDAFYLAGRLADSELTDRIPVEAHAENDQWGSEPSEK